MRGNNYSLSDVLFEPTKMRKHDLKNLHLCKIETRTFEDALRLHKTLSMDPSLRRFVLLPQYWDVEKLVYCESKVTTTEKNNETSSKLTVIAFDIETVSSEKDRLPTGEMVDDILFTASIWIDYEGDGLRWIKHVGISSSY
jgi:hypothetical protein